MRRSRKELERVVELLSRETGIEFGLEIWSPGDGTRYYLSCESGGRKVGHTFIGAGPMYEALYLAAEVVGRMKNAGVDR